MSAPSPPASRRLTDVFQMIVLACVALVDPPGLAQAARGQWTELRELGGEAIHMALLPDPDTGYPNRHSRLVWWQSKTVGDVLRGRHLLRRARPRRWTARDLRRE